MGGLTPGSTGTQQDRRRWWAAAAILLVVAVGLVVLGQRTAVPDVPAVTSTPPQPVASSAPPAASGPVQPARPERPAPKVRRTVSPPQHLSIPAIGVSTDLVRLGLNDDRTVEVPEVAARAGWYDQGPIPGQVGSSVILGHVDSAEGPAVFYRLSELAAGDRIDVRLTDGALSRFRVSRVAVYENEDFPAVQVYAGSPRRSTLNLVTCGGEYDPERGGYQSNVVVFTEKVPTAPPASATTLHARPFLARPAPLVEQPRP